MALIHNSDQFDPTIDLMIKRTHEAEDQDYKDKAGVWADAFPNEGPYAVNWPEAPFKEASGARFTCPGCGTHHTSPSAIYHAFRTNACNKCGHYIDNEGEGGTPYLGEQQGFAFTCPSCGVHSSDLESTEHALNYGECKNCGASIDNEDENGTPDKRITPEDYSAAWKEAASRPQGPQLECYGCGTTGGYEKFGVPNQCPHCKSLEVHLDMDWLEKHDKAMDAQDIVGENPYAFDDDDWEKKLRESSKELHIVTICDNCGVRDKTHISQAPNIKDWSFEGDKDYCPNCSNEPCLKCGCEEYPQTEHISKCRRLVNKGNCSCPPCGCECHA